MTRLHALPKVPRLPALPDVFRRVDVPRDLESVTTIGFEVDPREVDMTPEGVERIWSEVEDLYRSGIHPAIQLYLRREGHNVLDRAIGHARGNGPEDPADAEKILATPETPFCIFSASKAIAATVVHLLDERGMLHIGDRVAEYIPEYAAYGKDAITIAHVLSHRAGVAHLPPGAIEAALDQDWETLTRLLCQARPSMRAGKALAYHAVSGGFILAEIVRRVTGKGIEEVLAQEILDPLGFRWTNFGVRDPADVALIGHSSPTGAPPVPPLSLLLTRAFGMSVDEVTRLSNTPRFLTSVMPAANGVSTGRELSRFFELLRCGGELDGVRVLEPRTIGRAITEQSYRQVDLTLAAPLRHSLGFMLGAQWISIYGPDTEYVFGHLGFTNTIGWADPERALSGALVTSGKPVLYRKLPQLWNVMRRIGVEAPKVPGFTPFGPSSR
jgi:CubicO group peptidase (beta-lactamase class C family)